MNDFEDLRALTDSLQKEVWTLAKTEIPEIKDQLAALDPDADSPLASQIETNATNISSLTSRVGTLETQSSGFSTSLTEVESDVNRIDLQAASNMLNIEDLEETISSLQTTITSLTNRIETLEENSSAVDVTVIYDRNSTDEDVNLGLTNGFYAGYGINHNFKQYKYIKLYFRVAYWNSRYVKTEELWEGDCRIAYVSPYSHQGLAISTVYFNSSMTNITFSSTYLLELSGSVTEDATVTISSTTSRTYGLIEKIEGYK